MANKIVFDSSALIMLFAKELGYESIRHHMKYAIISSVNIAEVYKYCIEVQNLTEDDCRNLIKLSGIKIIDFCEETSVRDKRVVLEINQNHNLLKVYFF